MVTVTPRAVVLALLVSFAGAPHADRRATAPASESVAAPALAAPAVAAHSVVAPALAAPAIAAHSVVAPALAAPAIVAHSVAAHALAAPAIVAQVGGVTRAAVTDGRAIYAGAGARVIVLDACDPGRALEIGRSAPLPGIVQDLAVTVSAGGGALLVVALGEAGVAVLDVGDPARPELLSTIALPGPPPDLPGEAYRLAAADRFVWVAGSGGLYGIDIAVPSAPLLRAHVAAPADSFGGRAFDVAVDGHHVFVAWGPAGLRVFDAEDPAVPVEIAADPGAPVVAGAIALQHGIAWVADGGQIRAVDVTTPGAPRALSARPVGAATDTAVDIAVSGIRAYVTSIDGDTLRGRVTAFDIADPAAIRPRGTAALNTPVGAPGPSLPDGALALLVLGRRLIVVGDRLGLLVLDGDGLMRAEPAPTPTPAPGDPAPIEAAPVPVALPEIWRHAASSAFRGVAASSHVGLALGADVRRGLALVERPLAGPASGAGAGAGSDPSAHIAAWTTVPSRARDVATYGTRAVVVDGQVHLVAIGTPVDPRYMSSVTSLTLASAVAVDEARRVAYVANGIEGLRVVTIEDDERLTLVGTLALISPSETTVPATALDVRGDLVAVVGGEWLFLVDVSVPSAPRTLGSIATGGGLTGVALQGEVAWVTGYAPGLLSFDVGDPTTPGQIGSATIGTGGWAIAIDRGGARAFVAAGAGGVVIFDIADPLLPTELWRRDTPGTALDVAVMSGEWAGPSGALDLGDGWPLVADDEGGLAIVGDPALAPPGPEASPPDAAPHRCPARRIWMPSARRG